jgi:hypothetical protein
VCNKALLLLVHLKIGVMWTMPTNAARAISQVKRGLTVNKDGIQSLRVVRTMVAPLALAS